MTGKKEKAKARKAAAAASKALPASSIGDEQAVQPPSSSTNASSRSERPISITIKETESKGSGLFTVNTLKYNRELLCERTVGHHGEMPENDEDLLAMLDVLKHKRCDASSLYGLLNHSCLAKCAIHITDDGAGEAIAIRKDVEAGKELTIHYDVNTMFVAFEQRQQLLLQSFNFIYKCDLCSLPPAERYTSDCRRIIMRHLLYWIEGADLPRAPPVSLGRHRGILPDMTLVSYILLFTQLAEAEGLIDTLKLGMSYVKLVHFVIFRAVAKRLRCLPEDTVTNIKMWWEKAQRLYGCEKYGPSGSKLDYPTTHMWATVQYFMLSIDHDNRTFKWKKLKKTFFPSHKQEPGWGEFCQEIALVTKHMIP